MSKLATHQDRKVIKRNATQDDYFALDGDEYRFTEMIDGEIEMAPGPFFGHQDILSELFGALRSRRESNKSQVICAPFDVVIDEFTILQPDLIYFRDASKRKSDNPRFMELLPDLIVEILSPKGEERDRLTKYALYEKAGIQNYWIVDPKTKTIDAFTLIDGVYVEVDRADAKALAAPPFADAPIALADIFPAS